MRYALILLALFTTCSAAAWAGEAEIVFFETKIRPLLSAHCLSCHGAQEQESNLRLDSREAMVKGGDWGPSLDEGNLSGSLLLLAVRHHEDAPAMPPEGSLSKEQIADLEQWVSAGAEWPKTANGEVVPVDLTTPEGIEYARKNHWAFQPIEMPQLPPRSGDATVENEVDLFIADRLAAKSWAMSPKADPRTRLRRLYYDLVGMPPTYAEVLEFEQNPTSEAWAKAIEDLLSRPQYGERWARHWLDIARYSDTKGYSFNKDRNYYHAFGYRDYVIRSFNDDKPFDRFVKEQLAADQIEGIADADYAAMGFITLGRRRTTNEDVDDQIDVITRGFLGLTMQCARCHDHKYDPLPAKDYYALYGILRSSYEPKEADLPVVGHHDRLEAWQTHHDEVTVMQEQLDALKKQIKDTESEEEKEPLRKDRNKLDKEVQEKLKNYPPRPTRAMIMRDKDKLYNPYVFLRGQGGNRGPRVKRRLPEVIGHIRDGKPFEQGSGRLELAESIADPRNPLTARVMVNRIWQHHFGEGLVRTPSDFGYRGDEPTHPELLDYLATKFIESGWSIKAMHRLILTSYAYQQSSLRQPESEQAAGDPENLLLWRANSERLEWEPIRDSILAVSGRLDSTIYGAPYRPWESSKRRAIYMYLDRYEFPELLRNFDFANPDATTGQRTQTTVPQQALFMMNSKFVIDEVRELMLTIRKEVGHDHALGIRRLYQTILQREPTEQEAAVMLEYIQQSMKEDELKINEAFMNATQVLLCSNEFLFSA
ncbi:PSD1 and planctomycete cytochrome C domain-containing protein [Calycomorphotria hydatis]|uniref:Planctomycete cytochrome C n=1 Tax=Calycomorphotria hydatis TaxID=2528027 RepID=A0A517TES6_9PLAN|nr:PSD1 and planctomycete cytochrome C domain-containing protein [Calycomorphotria hydatis]QDT66872.1 Planctomycete cytochrome C [Calycomorphotria hydatis]